MDRIKLYDYLYKYSQNNKCDYFTLVNAYKDWYDNFGYLLLNKDSNYIWLKIIDKKLYSQMIEYTKRNFLDVRVLKEILKLEYDIKNRLSKFPKYFFGLNWLFN